MAKPKLNGDIYRYFLEIEGPSIVLSRTEYKSALQLAEYINKVHEWVNVSVEDNTSSRVGDLPGSEICFGWLLDDIAISVRDESGEYIKYLDQFGEVDLKTTERQNMGECFPGDDDVDGSGCFYTSITDSCHDRLVLELKKPFDPSRLVVRYKTYVDAEGADSPSNGKARRLFFV